MGYYGYTYARVQVRLSKDTETTTSCFDTGCSTSLIDCAFLKRQNPTATIRAMARPLKVKGISGNEHSTADYVVLKLRIPGTDDKTKETVEAVVTREIHVVDGLEANLLIGSDIMVPEKMDLILLEKRLCIGSCNVSTAIEIRIRRAYQRHKHLIHSKSTTTILPNTITTIPIHGLTVAATDHDFIFELAELDYLLLFSHVVNSGVTGILVKNNFNYAVTLPRNARLGYLYKLGVEQGLAATAFSAHADDFDFTAMAEKPPRRSTRPG